MKLISVGLDRDTKQASLVLMSSFTKTLGHRVQHDTKVLNNLIFLSLLVEFVRSSFVKKDCQFEHLQPFIKIEQGSLEILDYNRKFNDS
jgi:hypothetical protein